MIDPSDPRLSNRLVQLRAMIEDTLRDPNFVELCGLPPLSTRGDVALADLAHRHILEHEERVRLFGSDGYLFGDPAWQLMLCLFVRHDEARTPISTATRAASVPHTTGLRWIERLEERGFVSRTKNPRDGRSTFVGLTARGFAMVSGVLRREMAALAGEAKAA